MKFSVRTTLLSMLLSLVGLNGLLASAAHAVPTVEIFANQVPILIGRGQGKTLQLLGAVYDERLDGGKVLILPKVSKSISCPLFFNGDNIGLSIPGNSTNVPFRLTVFVPASHPLGDFTCTLRYAASRLNLVTGIEDILPTKMNDVVFKYTVKNRMIF